MDRVELFNKIYNITSLNPHKLNNLKSVLVERAAHLNGQIENVRKWHKEKNTDPIGCPEIGILTNEIIEADIQLNIIDEELRRLQSEKAESNKNGEGGGKRGVNVCIGNVEMNKPTFEKMLPKMNELFFDDSIIDQWECIIKNKHPTPPIKVKKNTSIIDLRLFFDLLSENEIFESGYLTPLINLKAFFLTDPKQNKILEYDQLKQAKKYINKRKIKPKFSFDDFLA